MLKYEFVKENSRFKCHCQYCVFVGIVVEKIGGLNFRYDWYECRNDNILVYGNNNDDYRIISTSDPDFLEMTLNLN